MSGEVGRAKRIAFARLQPADVLFFGARGPSSSPSEVDHSGIYLGGGWMIQSSNQGVAVVPLAGWYRQRFAWARLTEAGLTWRRANVEGLGSGRTRNQPRVADRAPVRASQLQASEPPPSPLRRRRPAVKPAGSTT